ncbi:hypothetical protein [Diaphorobacter nitroreducens]|uniref:hypothetical protein n=1 Tax=Diaphorobacter nitroreducens TaxID=164759 RepID=UPI002896EF6F|nr:hypothetical protein [Diaphorobacter nitroreducens]
MRLQTGRGRTLRAADDAGIEDDLRSEECFGYYRLRPASSSGAAVLAMKCGQRPIPG